MAWSVCLSKFNWDHKKSPITMDFFHGWLLRPVWYLNFRYPTAHLKLSTESFTCSVGHLKFTYQTQCSNLLMYIDNINFLLPSQFKDAQIYWNPQPDIWSQEPRPKIWGLVYKSRLKHSVGYQDPRLRV